MTLAYPYHRPAALPRTPMPLVLKYTTCLARGGKYIVLLFWAAVFVVGVVFAPRFLTATSISFDPPAGTPSALAAGRLSLSFPTIADSVNMAVVVEAVSPGYSVTSPAVRSARVAREGVEPRHVAMNLGRNPLGQPCPCPCHVTLFRVLMRLVGVHWMSMHCCSVVRHHKRPV